MTFVHGWALAVGAAVAAMPVIIHWLTRPRPVRLPLSTIRFVREGVRQRRARHRLRDFVVLGLRTLAVLLIAWAGRFLGRRRHRRGQYDEEDAKDRRRESRWVSDPSRDWSICRSFTLGTHPGAPRHALNVIRVMVA
jgi:aerotolerance regulator-like protein